MRVTIGICTFRRPHVAETLRAAQAQSGAALTADVLVADNDETPSAQALVEATIAQAAPGAPPARYLHAPARNISIARNAILDAAEGDWIAFLDDDETVAPAWLATLAATAERTGADVVFGAVVARYPADAPAWIRDGDFHSTRIEGDPQRRGQGHSGAVLMRWRGAPWADVRFDLALGRSGGEDTLFFDTLRARGARMAYAPDAVAQEEAPPARLTFDWLWRRRFRYGQTHAALLARDGATAPIEMAKAAAKAAACFAMAGMMLPSPVLRRRWLLRGALHCGVAARFAGRRDLELY